MISSMLATRPVFCFFSEARFQNPARGMYRRQRGSEVVYDKREVLLAALLKVQRLFLDECIHRQGDCPINHAVEDSIGIARDVHVFLFSKRGKEFTQDVV